MNGVAWSFIDNIVGSGISFLVGIILARLLSPSDFGLIGMITVLFAIASTFIDSGFSTGLIRKLHCTQEEYSTVFYFNIIICCIIYIFLFILAPYLASFFNEIQLTILVRILSTAIFIDSITIVQRVILTRDINFKLQTKISLISSVSSGIIGIIMAYMGYGVWSLVCQIITKKNINGFLLWIYSKWRPSLCFSISAFKELFKFGSKLLGSGLIVTIQNNIYYFVIGKFFSASGLGYFTRAEQFNAIVTNNITGTLDRVFFPVLASIQSDELRLKATFKKMVRTSFFITYFSLMVMAIIAKPMIFLLIGEKWEPSILYLQLICIGSIFFPFNVVNSNILKVKGRSDLILRLQIIKTILTTLIILSGIFKGIIFMLSIKILMTLFETILNSQYSSRLIDYSIKEQIKDILTYFWSINIILVIIFTLTFLPIQNLFLLILQIIVGIVLFILIFEKRKHPEYLEIKEMIISRINK